MAKSIIYNVVLVLANAEQIPRDDSQPNLVFVLTDDLGWGDVSYNNHNLHTTPFLKNLTNRKNNYASILKQSYATHRCTPSRASFLTGTGKFSHSLRAQDVAPRTNVARMIPSSMFHFLDASYSQPLNFWIIKISMAQILDGLAEKEIKLGPY